MNYLPLTLFCLCLNAGYCPDCHSAELKDNITLIVYTSEGCSPCIVVKKHLVEIGVKFSEIDFKAVNFIDVTPTVVICKDGKEIDRIVGRKTLAELTALLKDYSK